MVGTESTTLNEPMSLPSTVYGDAVVIGDDLADRPVAGRAGGTDFRKFCHPIILEQGFGDAARLQRLS